MKQYYSLINQKTNPPGGWRWRDSLTGFIYNRGYSTWEALKSHIKNHRLQNGHPIPKELKLEVMTWLCQQKNMSGLCYPVRSAKTYRDAGLVWLKSLIPGSEDVALAEDAAASKRAAICRKCPFNEKVAKDSHLERYTDAFVEKTLKVSGRKTKHDGKLKTCTICGCPLRAKVHLPWGEVNKSLDKNQRMSLPHTERGDKFICWMLEDVEA